MTKDSPREPVIERARKDVARGDHWLAHRWLHSRLNSNGYDPELLNEMGRLAYEMHDKFDAGRKWLLSTATGPEVDEAIECFVQNAGKTPEAVASQMLHQTRLSDCPKYPDVVQDRLRQYGLLAAIPRKPVVKSQELRMGLILGTLSILVALFAIVSLVIGMSVVGQELWRWIFG